MPTPILQMDDKPPLSPAPEDDTPPSPLTTEARLLVEKAAQGGVPMYATANLVRIAEENGISVSPETTPNQIIDELRRRGRPGET
jgi:hypothetical protein